MDKKNIDYAIEKLSELTNNVGGDYVNFLISKLHLDIFMSVIVLAVAVLAIIVIVIYTVKSGEGFYDNMDSFTYFISIFIVAVTFIISFIVICTNMYDVYLSSKFPEMWALQKFMSK